jgi:hypothetical protein
MPQVQWHGHTMPVQQGELRSSDDMAGSIGISFFSLNRTICVWCGTDCAECQARADRMPSPTSDAARAISAGLTIRGDRPDDKLPYGGAWLNIGSEMIHLMELPNPDAGAERPEHGGRDRHFCIGVGEGAIATLSETLDREGVLPGIAQNCCMAMQSKCMLCPCCKII